MSTSPARVGAHVAALLADVGGSNARFGWLDAQTRAVRDVATLAVAEHAGIAPAARSYLAELQARHGAGFAPPKAAAIAVATAISGDRVELTNSHWSFSQQELRTALDVTSLQVINDFEALALALPRLSPQQMHTVGPLAMDLAAIDAGDSRHPGPTARATLAVVGPGTGMGVASVVRTAAGWVAVPGEGGHATLAAVTEDEGLLLAHLRRRFEHVSAERLLSGIGLPVLHAAVCELAGAGAQPGADTPHIVHAALAGDELADRTLQTFCSLLGGFAGNVALTVGARGGLFIGGGIVPRLGGYFERSAFRERFESKGRFRSYLQRIPTAVITDTLVALTGAAASLEQAA